LDGHKQLVGSDLEKSSPLLFESTRLAIGSTDNNYENTHSGERVSWFRHVPCKFVLGLN